ncbi:MAG: hypothetical protein ABI396_19405 [Ktedonobacteraceae bacterium]
MKWTENEDDNRRAASERLLLAEYLVLLAAGLWLITSWLKDQKQMELKKGVK